MADKPFGVGPAHYLAHITAYLSFHVTAGVNTARPDVIFTFVCFFCAEMMALMVSVTHVV